MNTMLWTIGILAGAAAVFLFIDGFKARKTALAMLASLEAAQEETRDV